MSSVSNILLDEEILLESGTNELEVLVFDVADFRFGINVAKVREVLPKPKIHFLPNAHESIRGVFHLRDHVVPCVSLATHLDVKGADDQGETQVILTDFNCQQTAFLVDRVEKIYRLSWESIMNVPGVEAMRRTPVTALARCGDRLTLMLDFEMIHDQVTNQFFRSESVPNPHQLPRDQLRIVLADDSPTVRDTVTSTLRDSGYTDLVVFENGQLAWDWIESQLTAGAEREQIANLVISDVEMPQMDGLHLTKRIKDHQGLSGLPVLLYSSIVTPDNHKKGVAVGADEQVSKPELAKIVELADSLIMKSRGDQRDAPTANEPRNSSVAPKRPADDAPASEVAPPREIKPAPPLLDHGSGSEAPLNARPVPPSGVRPKLWETFVEELEKEGANLGAWLTQPGQAVPSEATLQKIRRSLHTIKSAAMVLPLDAVSQTTHLIESVVELGASAPSDWPSDALSTYVTWLRAIWQAGENTSDVLARSVELKSAYAALLAEAGCTS